MKVGSLVKYRHQDDWLTHEGFAIVIEVCPARSAPPGEMGQQGRARVHWLRVPPQPSWSRRQWLNAGDLKVVA